MNKKIPVGILGCTGAVGQKFVSLLTNHPQFVITDLAASENSAGKKYIDCVKWHEPTPIPEDIASLTIKKCDSKLTAKILFSGLDSSVAGEIEENYAQQGYYVISNSKNHRLAPDVPLVIPEINSAHFALIKHQQQQLNSSGFIVTNPNCAIVVLALALYPIHKKFGLEKVIVTTMQAISGAGYPGVASLDILGNVIPHIKDEEEKIQIELLKIFGTLTNDKIVPADCKISAMCNRVPVQNGHTMAISFATKTTAAKEEIISSLQDYPTLNLPSSPKKVVSYFADALRPQPLLDLNSGNGMTVSVGNLRACNVLDWKLTAFGHNTIRGAAGAAILNAEYLVQNKYL
jgi:aspartate-semialdehyde dehydrogenase